MSEKCLKKTRSSLDNKMGLQHMELLVKLMFSITPNPNDENNKHDGYSLILLLIFIHETRHDKMWGGKRKSVNNTDNAPAYE